MTGRRLTYTTLAARSPRVDHLPYVLRDEVERGRVTVEDDGYRIVPEAFTATVLAALAALNDGDLDGRELDVGPAAAALPMRAATGLASSTHPTNTKESAMTTTTPPRRTYGSDPFAYDFAAELTTALNRKHTQTSPTTPTVAAFITHARKHGSECVLDTGRRCLTDADLCQLELELTLIDGPSRLRQRRTTTALAEQVIALDRRGLVAAAIADTLNISDRRVSAILAKSRTSENGGSEWLNQAEDSAAKPVGRPGGHPSREQPDRNGRTAPTASRATDALSGAEAMTTA